MINFDGTDCQLVVIGDFGKDPDDAFALLNGYKVDAYIATLHPSDMRARLAKGLLKSLGREETPVYVGQNPGFDQITVADYEFDFKISQNNEVITSQFSAALGEILSKQLPTVIVVNAAMSDIKDYFTFEGITDDLKYKKHIKAIIMQGGYDIVDNEIVPNNAANNMYDIQAAKFCFGMIQYYKIPFYIITRQFAYDYPIPATYANLPSHAVSRYLQSVHIEALEALYKRSCYPAGDLRRESLPDDRDAAWFFKNIVKGPIPEILPDTIGHLITTLNVYDVFSVLFAQNPENFTTVSVSDSSTVFEVKPLPGFDYQSWILEHSINMLT
jgi:hypothetical protein